MKKLLLILSTAISFFANGQTSVYHSFPDSAAVWREASGWLGGGNPPQQHNSEYQYFINGDTVYNSNTYHKIYLTGKDFVWPPPPYDTIFYYEALSFGIREDSNKRIWINFFHGADQLLYDFNLNIGDTLHTYNGQLNVIIGIDSVLVGTQFRKTYLLSYFGWTPPSDGTFIIEGIGSSTGLTNPIRPPFEGGGFLKCFMQDGQFLYSASLLSNCNLISGLPEISSNKISSYLFPNPFHSSATFKISDAAFENSCLKIYNVLGEEIKQQTIINNTTIIFRDGMQDGIYFFRVINNNEQVVAGKFVIE